MVGLIVDALYAHTLPVLLAVYTFSLAEGKSIPVLQLNFLAVWQTLSGIRNILLHQHDDMAADQKSGVKNWVATISQSFFYHIVLCVVCFEIVCCVLFFSALSIQNIFFLLCVIIIIGWAVYTFVRFSAEGMNSYMSNYWKYFPNTIYEKWLPPALLVILSFRDIRFFIILLIHVLLFNIALYLQTFGFVFPRIFYPLLNHVYIPMRRVFSALINYPIYYCFLLFGVDLKKEKLSALEYLRKKNDGRTS